MTGMKERYEIAEMAAEEGSAQNLGQFGNAQLSHMNYGHPMGMAPMSMQ